MSNVLTTHPADYITVSMARLIEDGERVFHGVASPCQPLPFNWLRNYMRRMPFI